MNNRDSFRKMEDFEDFQDLACRVCFNVEELMVSIYEAVEDSQSNLSELLELCGGLKVSRFDKFPKYLCKECTSELLIASKFREKCSKSQQLLENIIQIPVDLNFKTETDSSAIVKEENEINVELMKSNIDSLLDADDLIAEESEYANFSVEKFKTQESEHSNFSEENSDNMQNEFHDSFEETMDDDLTVEDLDNNVSDVLTCDEDDDSITGEIQSVPDFRFCCDICGAAFHYIANLTKHFLSHSCQILFTCQRCNYPFSKEIEFFKHSKDCEKDASILKNKDTKDIVDLCGNIKKCNKRSDTICSYCQKDFKTWFALSTHIRTHTGDRPYQCSVCDKTFKTQYAMQLHSKRHKGSGDLACNICGKKFHEKSNLKVHMRIHTGEKPHKCITCGMRFTRVFCLKLHHRTHTGEKPYKCQQCGRAFAQKCDLTTHTRLHTGSRPYTCPICFKGCIKSSSLSCHMKLKHPSHDLSSENPPQKNC